MNKDFNLFMSQLQETNQKNYITYRKKIAEIVKAEDTQTSCLMCQEPLAIMPLPFLDD